MIPLFKVRMSDQAADSVKEVLDSGYIGQGQQVEEFEDLLWKELNTDTRPVTVNSCTSAIDLALELCGVGLGDEVVSTPQTCFASQVGAIHRHARIRWADIDPETGLVDPDTVEAVVTPRTKAIIVVNWAGKFCDYDKLKSFGVPVIEDAAHTWDAVADSPKGRGDYICYSFQAIKFLTCGDGGILVTPPEKEEEARLLRWYGLDRTKGASFRCTQNIQQAGFKYHMNDIAASIGISNLPVARDSVIKHMNNAKAYCEAFAECENIFVPPYDPNCCYWLYSVYVRKRSKEAFITYLKQNGIAANPVHYRNDQYDCTEEYSEGDLPGVHQFGLEQVCIPVGWWLTTEERDHIIDVVKAY